MHASAAAVVAAWLPGPAGPDAIAPAGGAPVRAGLAFACQEVDVVPADGTDVALELVVTEAGCLPVEGPPPFP